MVIMLACDSEFIDEDTRHPGYSLCEYDIYAWAPYAMQVKLGMRNHRLSMWKNLKTGEYELYRNYHDAKNEYEADIIFKSKSLMDTLARAVQEWDTWHAIDTRHDPFKPCQHTWKEHAMLCRARVDST